MLKNVLVVLAIALMVSSAYGWSYVAYDDPDPTHADFVGSWTPEVPQPQSGVGSALPDPLKNPNGPWTYLYDNAGTYAPSVATGGIQWSGQNGWAVPGNTTGLYGLFGKDWPIEPTKVLDVGITGHSNSAISFTVPAFDNASSNGVQIDGIMQVYEDDNPATAPRPQVIIVTGTAGTVAVLDAPSDNLEYTGGVTIPAAPGDVLLFEVLPAGHLGGASGTFSSWDLTITEIPEPMTMTLLGLGSLFALRRRRA